MSKEAGGPAFPSPALANENFNPVQDLSGMTLRDYFAAKSLIGMLCCDKYDHDSEQQRRNDYQQYCMDFAISAYSFADAMLEARK